MTNNLPIGLRNALAVINYIQEKDTEQSFELEQSEPINCYVNKGVNGELVFIPESNGLTVSYTNYNTAITQSTFYNLNYFTIDSDGCEELGLMNDETIEKAALHIMTEQHEYQQMIGIMTNQLNCGNVWEY